MIIHQSRWLRTGEVWFDEEPATEKVDVIRYMQRTHPVAGSRYTVFQTLVIDLSKSEDELLSTMTKDTRYEIRRADSRDRLVCKFSDRSGGGALARFCECYDRFASSKGLPPANRSRLNAYADAGALHLTCALDESGAELVWHVYYRGAARVRLLHSASLFRETADSAFRNLVGRANRYLHWQDMLRFKKDGVAVYDLGGWYGGAEDEEKVRINRFKEEFGGQVVENYNCLQKVTAKARLIFAAGRLLGRV